MNWENTEDWFQRVQVLGDSEKNLTNVNDGWLRFFSSINYKNQDHWNHCGK